MSSHFLLARRQEQGTCHARLAAVFRGFRECRPRRRRFSVARRCGMHSAAFSTRATEAVKRSRGAASRAF